MSQTTPQMNLTGWDLASDPYDHSELYQNWVNIDAHDHTGPPKGVQLPLDALEEPVDNAHLADDSVSTSKIQDGAVTKDKMTPCSVGPVELCNNAVTSSHILDGNVQSAEIANGAVTEPKLNDGAVTTQKIAAGAVVNSKLGDSSVSSTKIANQGVTEPKMADNSVATRALVAGSVTNAKLGTDSVTQPKIADDSVGVAELAAVPTAGWHRNTSMQITKTVGPTQIWTPITWNVERWSYLVNNPGDGLEITVRGIYLIEAGLSWDDTGVTNGVRRARITKNGTVLGGSGPYKLYDDDAVGPFIVRHSISVTDKCAVGDLIKLEAFTSATSNSQIRPDHRSTHISVTWIAPAV